MASWLKVACFTDAYHTKILHDLKGNRLFALQHDGQTVRLLKFTDDSWRRYPIQSTPDASHCSSMIAAAINNDGDTIYLCGIGKISIFKLMSDKNAKYQEYT